MHLSNERFLPHPWKLRTYHSQARSQRLSDPTPVYLMALENNIKFKNLKVNSCKKSIKITSHILYDPL